MLSTDDVYGGNFLSAKDVKEGEVLTCKIKEVKLQEVGEKQKIVLLLESGKEFVSNKINAIRLAETFGTKDYTQWEGKAFSLIRSWTTYGGEEVPCLRVQRKLE